ncbi:hypothetical protein GCM10027285_28010 [Oleiagrimonas citrea]|uniref:Uncharacterized protein n=1 Tax=Oleiagrimonas citrea TaxID=1665687 RepID=A0A846ZLQ3_9GAMM|nr:hypothetical protein [Oleiagrimonas citrea]NKZ39134.1 hypothetical protein [Oleiagrimonas citrea]
MDRSNDGKKKPSTRGFVTTSQGRRVKVDELDMAVLNIGHGNHPMTPAHLTRKNSSFMRPVYNVDYKDELATNPRRNSSAKISYEVYGDANAPDTIRRSTGLSQFDEIHAINPYAYDPLTTAGSLLAPQGSLHVTGTKSNPFAKPITSDTTSQANIGTRELPNKIPVQRLAPSSADLTHVSSTDPGTMHPVHQQFPHELSGGQQMKTTTSQTHTYRKNTTNFHDVTPSQDSTTRRNTALNTSISAPSVQTKKSSTPKKRVSFAPLPKK